MDKDLSARVSRRLAKTIRSYAKSRQHVPTEGTATFVRKDSTGTCWVRLPGADADTPVNGGYVATAEPGDSVRYRIDGTRLTVTGNVSDPSVGMNTLVSNVASASDTIVTLLNRTIGSVTSVIMATADGIMSVVSEISSSKYLTSSDSGWTNSNIESWSSEGTSHTWSVTSTSGVRVGDVVYVKGTDSSRSCSVYVKGTVTAIGTGTVTMTSHGYEDTLPVSTVKSTINQSPTSVKIQAQHVDIEGAAIFTNGRLSEETLDSTYDAYGAADGIEVGGRNWLRDTQEFDCWDLDTGITASEGVVTFPVRTSLNWYRLTYPGLIPIEDFIDETWTLSFDYRSDDFSDTSGDRRIHVEKFYYVSYEDVNPYNYAEISGGESSTFVPVSEWQRGSITFDGLLSGIGSNITYAGIAFYQHTKNGFQLRNIKLERGNKATDYTVAPEDVDNRIDSVGNVAANAYSVAYGANKREQLIYKSAAEGTTSMNAYYTWVSDGTGSQNTWTTKRPQYSQSYPVLFVATQRQTVYQTSGTSCSCTTPHIDDTTTIIDGGHIITNSITAQQMALGTLTIGNIDTSDSDTADALLNRPTWGYCDSKVSGYDTWFAVEADGFELIDGSEIAIYFDIAHSNYYFELDVNDTGHKPVVVNGVASGEGMGHIAFNAGSTLTFRYYGNAYYLIDKAGTIDGACSTAHDTATKVVTVDGPFLIMEGTILNVHFSTKNSYVSGAIYLSVGGNVSKVCVDELETSSSNTLLWDANKVLSFVYRGEYWYFVGVSNASKTATDYITHIDNNGVKIHDSGDTSNYLHLTSSGADIYAADSLAAKFAASLIELGVSSASAIIKMCAGALSFTTYAASGNDDGGSEVNSQSGLRLWGHIESSDDSQAGRSLVYLGGTKNNQDAVSSNVLISADSDPSGTAVDTLDHWAYISVEGGVAKTDSTSVTVASSSRITFHSDRISLTASAWLDALGGYVAKTTLPLNTTDCQEYDTWSTPYYEKRAGLVIVSGAVKPKNTVSAGGSLVIATLPDGCRPVQATTVLCQGTDNATWLLEIKTYNNQAGTMVASRYRNGSTNAQMTTSTWLPFHVVFPVQ